MYVIDVLPAGVKPKVSEDTFEDLLGGHTFSKKQDGPRTIKEMKRGEEERITDPDVLKVNRIFPSS